MRHTKFLLDVPAGEVTPSSKAFQFAWAGGQSGGATKRPPSSPGADGARHKLARQHFGGPEADAVGGGAALRCSDWELHAPMNAVQPFETATLELVRMLQEAGEPESWPPQ